MSVILEDTFILQLAKTLLKMVQPPCRAHGATVFRVVANCPSHGRTFHLPSPWSLGCVDSHANADPRWHMVDCCLPVVVDLSKDESMEQKSRLCPEQCFHHDTLGVWKERKSGIYIHCDYKGFGAFLSSSQSSAHHWINESVETHEWLGRIIGLSCYWIEQIYEVKEKAEQVPQLICLQKSQSYHGGFYWLLSKMVKTMRGQKNVILMI